MELIPFFRRDGGIFPFSLLLFPIPFGVSGFWEEHPRSQKPLEEKFQSSSES